jgi:predicted DNA binding protein
MDLWELMLELEEGNPLIDVSLAYPNKSFIMWYLWNRQLIKFEFGTDEELHRVIELLKRKHYKINKAEKSDNLALVLAECEDDGNIDVWNISTSMNCLELPPALFTKGKGIFRIAGFDEKSIKGFVQKVNRTTNARIIHKKRLPLNVIRSSLWTSSILSSFSQRQAESLIKAQQMGYYETPRRVTTGEVAKAMRLSRSTFEDHLRKAENIVFNSFVPYLKLFNSYEENDFYHQTLESPLSSEKFEITN